jgi:hypothetical protein
MKRTRAGLRALVAMTSAILLLAAALLVGVVATATPSSAASNGTFSIFPYQAPGSTGTGRPLFDFSLKEGQEIADAFTLSNDSHHALAFDIYPADAYDVAAGGGFALTGHGQQNVGVGSWVQLPKSLVQTYQLAADSQVTVPFTVSVPADASPGDHAGGIVALEVTPPHGTKSKVHFSVQQGVGVRVYVHVLGPLHPGLAVQNLKTNVSVPPGAFLTGSSKADVTFDVVNTGNTIYSSVLVRSYATNLFGSTVETFRPMHLATVLPGSRETITEPQWSPLPLAGPVTVHVQLVATRVNHRYTSSFWVVPWLLVVVVLLAVAALGVLLWRIWRRRKARSQRTESSNEERSDGETLDTVTSVSTTSETHEGS